MNVFGTNSWEILSAPAVFLIGILLALRLARAFGTPGKRSLILYLWHTIFCFLFLWYAMGHTSDAMGYFKYSRLEPAEFALGTNAVLYITGFFSSILQMSVVGVFLVYNIVGFVGLLAFDASLRTVVAGKNRQIRRVSNLIVFLPSVSFWSSAIGKDAVAFAATGLALWSSLDLRRRGWLLVPAISLMIVVRPHIGVLMLAALAVSMAVHSKAPAIQRWLLGLVGVAIAAVLVPSVLDYTGVSGEGGVSSLVDFIERQQGYNMQGGGAVDISSMSFPMQLFTYLFRPLPFEVSSIPGTAAGIDNVVLLFIFLLGGYGFLKRRSVDASHNRTFLWLFSLSAWAILAMTSANLGISLRQKWMFAPMLIFLLISIVGRSRANAPIRGGGRVEPRTAV